MTVQQHRDAQGPNVTPPTGINATLHRFELIRGELIRERPADVQPRIDRERFLIDVLLNEDEVGRYFCGVRGFIVPRQGDGRADPGGVGARRSFEVGTDLMLAVGEALSVGPRLRQPPRLATLDGRHVG